jgi:beta-1,2-mannobiose phosphorylase / 1,2-beta-oligomannan phosphorylase
MHLRKPLIARRPGFAHWLTAAFTAAIVALMPVGTLRAVAQGPAAEAEFPAELVQWAPCAGNPVFTAQGPGHWDAKIRERGWILRDGDTYRLWYTGYDGTREGIKQLGYATSPDGRNWTPWPTNPLCREHWIEDMTVVKQGDRYYMFAESGDENHTDMLTSPDGVDWKWEGPLDIRLADGQRPARKPGGTPTIWIEGDVWYLFYEWRDLGVWLAKTSDPASRVWINVQDEPVMSPGPADYDNQQIAFDQVIKHRDAYFAFYHSCSKETPKMWGTNIARSTDLVHWQKYALNPLIPDKSSGMVVAASDGLLLVTMHDQIDLFCPLATATPAEKSSADTGDTPTASPAAQP